MLSGPARRPWNQWAQVWVQLNGPEWAIYRTRCPASVPLQKPNAGRALRHILMMATKNEKREISLSTSALNQSMEPFARRKRCIMKVDSRITGFWDLRQISTLAEQKIITVPLTSGSRFDPSGLSFLRVLDLQSAVKCTLDQLQPLLEQRSENNTFTRTRQLTTLIVAH